MGCCYTAVGNIPANVAALAISSDGTQIVYPRFGFMRSRPYPSLGSESTLFAGGTSATYANDGTLYVLRPSPLRLSTWDGVSITDVYTYSSSTASNLRWNPVDDRLYQLIGGSLHVWNGSTFVDLGVAAGAVASSRGVLCATPDGALWWAYATSTSLNSIRRYDPATATVTSLAGGAVIVSGTIPQRDSSVGYVRSGLGRKATFAAGAITESADDCFDFLAVSGHGTSSSLVSQTPDFSRMVFGDNQSTVDTVYECAASAALLVGPLRMTPIG